MAQPEVVIAEDSWLYIRLMTFVKAGDEMPAHAHDFDHYTALLQGSATFMRDGEEARVEAPNLIFVKAGEKHRIVALEDGTKAACIHHLPNLLAENLRRAAAAGQKKE